MAENNPPGFLQNAGATHTAEQMRNWHSLLLAGSSAALALTPRGGVNAALGNALSVTQTGSPSMAVIVKSGHAAISGTEGSKQGVYSVLNDADVTLSITAAHATLPRIDIVCFKVQDTAYSGAVNSSSLVVVTGTAASVPSPPTAPANSITLAQVAVAAAVSSIVNANITSTRTFLAGAGGLISVANSTERTALATYAGLAAYQRDTGSIWVHNGTAWTEFVVGTGNAWQTTWVPTLTNMTLGNGTQVTRFRQLGKSVDYYWQFVFGTTSTMGTVPSFTLPVAPASYYSTGRNGAFPGTLHLFQPGVTDRPGAVKISTGSTLVMTSWNATPAQSDITPTNPFTWATGFIITAWGNYEAA